MEVKLEHIFEIIELAKEAAGGKDNVKEGAVGSNGYGFVFREPDLNPSPSNPYIFSVSSQKLCGAGAQRGFLERLEGNSLSQKFITVYNITHSKIDNIRDLVRYERELDLLFAGSVKRLVPNLQFGGDERVFDVWMFVVTPEGQMFPTTLYWRQSGLSLGGWTSYKMSYFLKERIFPEDFEKLINLTPFEFSDEELNLFLDALEFALGKAPVSDFWGVNNADYGYVYLGVKNGEPFETPLYPTKSPDDKEAERVLEPLLGREFKTADGDSFSIQRVLDFHLYYIEFERPIFSKERNKKFSNAGFILDLYNKIMEEKRDREDTEKELEPLLGKEFKTEDGYPFTIYRLPDDQRLYCIESEPEMWKGLRPLLWNRRERKNISTAEKILDLYMKIMNVKNKRYIYKKIRKLKGKLDVYKRMLENKKILDAKRKNEAEKKKS